MLQCMIDFIENMMGIYGQSHSEMIRKGSTYISICGWFCGRSNAEDDASNHPSAHFSNILSFLDYHSAHREEMYWVIFQILNVVYKYHHHVRNNEGEGQVNVDIS